MNGLSGLMGGVGGMSGLGGAGLAASESALRILDETSAQTTMMNATAQADKMNTDTINSIMSGYTDSANKANNAATQSGKAINY
ncbi:hypothetical protein [Vibrio quintilis]|uniref:Uncharacterized protein n=1 Tax=Vibrio quintilis TaxID=1117707 RepID=A0A1M7YW12_9VIBR|nr:hypothetical protein [Vibrio quintilis]SHO56778.1 hypothetical protein VQ7734_02547 [Vibrio quintilis]